MPAAKDSVLMVIARGGVIGFGLLNTVLTARLLRPEGRGAYAVTMAALQLFILCVASIGNGVALSVAHDDHGRQRRMITNALGVSILIGLAPVIVLAGWRPEAYWRIPLLLVAGGAPFVGLVYCIQYACLGAGRLKWLAGLQVVQPGAASAFGAVLMGPAGLGLAGAMLAWTTSWVLVAVMGVAALHTIGWTFRLADVTATDVKHLVKFAVASAVPSTMAFAGNRALLILIELQIGLRAVGVYSVSLTLAEPLSTMAAGISSAAYPRLSPPNNRLARTKRLIQSVSAFALVGAIATAALSSTLLIPVFGAGYADALRPLPFLLLANIVLSGREIAIYYYMHDSGKLGTPVRACSLGAITTVLSAWALLAILGTVGASAAVLVGALITMLYLLRGMQSPAAPTDSLSAAEKKDDPTHAALDVIRGAQQRILTWVRAR